MTTSKLDFLIKHIKEYGKFTSLNKLKESAAKHGVCSRQTVQNLKEDLINSPSIRHSKTKDGEIFEYHDMANIPDITLFFDQSNHTLDLVHKQLKELIKIKRSKKRLKFDVIIDVSVKGLRKLEYIDTLARFYYNSKLIPRKHKDTFKSLIHRISDLKNEVYSTSHRVDAANTLLVLNNYAMEGKMIEQ